MNVITQAYSMFLFKEDFLASDQMIEIVTAFK